ncbi:type I restriction enzyme S subunit [Anoxybacillus tepidamans]|uniref:Type I restriction enzyme S subunit n=1 Tax=Anoxybacteroides tepidamans TaxID=265948 RepID=A0A7W8MX75_9BACL|nr:restriction endonuclease subunit S [Anoxybacillus tepidamans]MBB5326111.1 type I restriction enzyme S subunit [Anoxybacillus tepidamans]
MVSEWKNCLLGEVVEYANGSSFPNEFQGKKNGKYDFYKVSDMNNPKNSVFMIEAENTVDDEAVAELKAKIHPKDTVIFPKVGAALLTNKRRILSKPSLFDNNIMGLKAKKSILPKYLYYFMYTIDFGKFVQSGAVPSINKTIVDNLSIKLPPLFEQRKIAAILSSVDEAIEKTEVIIEQTEKVKKGLMQQLLTKGIGHTKFKKTEIGEIPEEWEVKALENISKFIDYRGKTPKKTERGIRLITAKNIRDGYISDEPIEFIAEEDYDSWMTRGIPEYGDVLFTTEAPLGNIAQLNIREKVAFAQRVIIIQPIIDKRFMKYVLMGERFQNEIESLSTGSTVKGIKSSVLKKVKIPVPPLEEQRRIGAILESFEGKLLTEKQKLERLKFIKIGLMQVLLTGKVRVKVDDEVMSQ